MKTSEYEAHKQYDEWLDEVYTPYNIGYLEWSASQVMKEMDPIAYQTGFNDWCDSENIELEEDE